MNNPLCQSLQQSHDILIQEIWKPFGEHGRWPTYGWLDHRMYGMGLDLRELLGTLPTLNRPQDPWRRYGLVIVPDLEHQSGVEVRLTVSGLHHVAQADPYRRGFLALVDGIVQAFHATPAEDPFAVPNYIFYEDLHKVYDTVREIGDRYGKPTIAGSKGFLRDVAQLMEREPWNEPLTAVQVTDPNKPVKGAVFTMEPPSVAALRMLRGHLHSHIAYLDLMVERYRAPAAPAVPPSAHPLDVVGAFSHLGAVWKATFGDLLMMDGDPMAFGRLTLPCTDAGTFDSQMSALADVMARMKVPGAPKPPQRQPLEKVRDFLLEADLPPASSARIHEAFDVFLKLRGVRHAGQHADAHHKVVGLARDLRLTWPPQDWGCSWSEIAYLVRGSLDAVREELRAGEDAFTALVSQE